MQTKRQSFIESICNVASGFLVSLFVQHFVVILILGITVPTSTNVLITGIFTVTSVIRSYFWRRWFNKKEDCNAIPT